MTVQHRMPEPWRCPPPGSLFLGGLTHPAAAAPCPLPAAAAAVGERAGAEARFREPPHAGGSRGWSQDPMNPFAVTRRQQGRRRLYIDWCVRSAACFQFSFPPIELPPSGLDLASAH